MTDKTNVKGIRAPYIFFPTMVITFVIHILIVICSILINIYSARMADETNESSDCINNISAILSHSSKLSDTVSSFAYNPEIPTGPNTFQLNDSPLKEYVLEISDETRDLSVIANKLNKHNINSVTMSYINDALAKLDRVIKTQAHAIRLIASKVEIPEYLLKKIPEYTLTEEELSYTKDVAKDKARDLLFERQYSFDKRDIATDITAAQTSQKEKFNLAKDSLNFHLTNLRICLWIMIITIIIITVVFFIVIIKLLVFPIIGFSKKINDNERLDSEKGMYEANLLAYSYNMLLDRHDQFEDELRKVAEFDSLTGLPNRYSYNEFLKREIPNNQIACVFMLDINDLKYENDTYGHDKGDELIKHASQCIREAFGEGSFCFRTGGDEFVVILNNVKKEDISNIKKNFFEVEKKYNVSIAIGYSYSDNVKEIGYEKLVIEADGMMYKNKEKVKKNG